MKTDLIAKIIFSLLCIFSCQLLPAQMYNARQDCYTSYKNQGDAYNKTNKYDLAIQQYQNAKYCNTLTAEQRKILDSLIADINRRRPKTMIRKY